MYAIGILQVKERIHEAYGRVVVRVSNGMGAYLQHPGQCIYQVFLRLAGSGFILGNPYIGRSFRKAEGYPQFLLGHAVCFSKYGNKLTDCFLFHIWLSSFPQGDFLPAVLFLANTFYEFVSGKYTHQTENLLSQSENFIKIAQ